MASNAVMGVPASPAISILNTKDNESSSRGGGGTANVAQQSPHGRSASAVNLNMRKLVLRSANYSTTENGPVPIDGKG